MNHEKDIIFFRGNKNLWRKFVYKIKIKDTNVWNEMEKFISIYIRSKR